MNTVSIIEDPYDISAWVLTSDVPDVLKFLTTHYAKWPEHARLYHGSIDQSNEVTPQCEADFEALQKLQGDFFVVNMPGFGIDLIWFALAAVLVAAVAFKPKIPNVANRATSSKSPNNELSARTNSARPKARIPDIFGQVRSTPDLLAVPYSTYVDNKEVENSLLCIGRGQYEIHDSRDGTTRASQIQGTSIHAWHPNLDVLLSAPFYSVGALITDPILYLQRNDATNGQVLTAPTSIKPTSIRSYGDLGFASGNQVIVDPASPVRFGGLFNDLTPVVLTNAKVRDPLLLQNRISTLNTQYSSAVLFQITQAEATGVDPLWIFSGDTLNLFDGRLRIVQYSGAEGFVTNIIDLAGDFEVDFTEIIGYTDPNTELTVNQLVVHLVNPIAINPAWDWNTQFRPAGTAAFMQSHDVNDQALLYDLSGTYDVLPTGVTDTSIALDSPETVVPEWASVTTYTGPQFFTIQQGAAQDTDYLVGPFSTGVCTDILLNVVALQGQYADDGDNKWGFATTLAFDITPININDDPIGPSVTYSVTLDTSADPVDTLTDSKGVTLRIQGLAARRYSVLGYRVTKSHVDNLPNGQIVEEIKWKDFYYGTVALDTNFGNVTVVRSRTIATDGALSLKERKLNMLVTRQVHTRIDNFATLRSTRRADEILTFMARDPWIGNRPWNQIDVDSIYDTIEEAQLYFGVEQAVEFCYTFDEFDMTFEESAQAVAQAAFCDAYRRGNILKLKLERENSNSTLLFNHRNKIPGSETRTVRFGTQRNRDGIAYTYVSPIDDAVVTRYLPEDRSAVNEETVESIGIRNDIQSHIHAWRAYSKMLYQNTTVKFQATEEAEMLLRNERILVADNTRPDTQDGEVVSTAGLFIEVSQKMVLLPGEAYTIFLQMYDGSMEAIPVGPAGDDPYALVLTRAPRLPLVVADASFAKTTFTLVRDESPRQVAFLVTERDSGDNTVSTVTAVNYSDKYYQHDQDYRPDPTGSWLSTLGNLVLWLDAYDETNIVLSSSRVIQWLDGSPALNTAQQPVEILRPNVSSASVLPRAINFVDESSLI